jgi:hypothetical protein
MGPVTSSCEHSNESWGSRRTTNLFYYQSDYRLLTNGSAPCSCLITGLYQLFLKIEPDVSWNAKGKNKIPCREHGKQYTYIRTLRLHLQTTWIPSRRWMSSWSLSPKQKEYHRKQYVVGLPFVPVPANRNGPPGSGYVFKSAFMRANPWRSALLCYWRYWEPRSDSSPQRLMGSWISSGAVSPAEILLHRIMSQEYWSIYLFVTYLTALLLIQSLQTIYLSIYGSTVFCLTLTAFSDSWTFTKSVELIGRGISPSEGRYLHTGQHTHRINKHRHPYLEWDSNTRSQCSSGQRLFMPQTARPLWSAVCRLWLVNNKLARMWKEAVVAYYEVDSMYAWRPKWLVLLKSQYSFNPEHIGSRLWDDVFGKWMLNGPVSIQTT